MSKAKKNNSEKIEIEYQFFKNKREFRKPFLLSIESSKKDIEKFIEEEKPDFLRINDILWISLTNNFDIKKLYLYLPFKPKQTYRKKIKDNSLI